jgi:hypothetical protein
MIENPVYVNHERLHEIWQCNEFVVLFAMLANVDHIQ